MDQITFWYGFIVGGMFAFFALCFMLMVFFRQEDRRKFEAARKDVLNAAKPKFHTYDRDAVYDQNQA